MSEPAPPRSATSTAGCKVGPGGCWERFLEGDLKDERETDLASLVTFFSNCPSRSVHNCDFLPQLLSLVCEAVIHFLPSGHQRGQPTRRCMSGGANLSTEVLNHRAHAEAARVPAVDGLRVPGVAVNSNYRLQLASEGSYELRRGQAVILGS